MRTLLDNSTLTSVFRAVGLIDNSNRDLFELDLSSLRLFIDNVLLSKEIIVVDNYKEEHSEERKKWLKHDCFNFIGIPEKVENKMLKNARAQVYNWELSRHLATDFAQIFDDLSILFRHAWRGSESFLVLKAFGIENKYNSTITKSLIEHIDKSQEVSKSLKKFSPKFYNKETLRLAQSVSWAAIRTVYYRQASKFLGCEYNSHPLRNVYNAKCILFDNHPFTRTDKLHSSKIIRKPRNKEEWDLYYEDYKKKDGYFSDIYQFFRYFWQSCNEKDDNIFGVQTFDIEIPPFLAYVLSKLDRYKYEGSNFLEVALELRDKPEITALRELLYHIYEECGEDDRPKAIREFARELRDLKERMQVHLGYERERVGISIKLISYNLTVPRFMTKPLYPHKPHLSFIRDIIVELASVGSMGRLIDQLWRKS